MSVTRKIALWTIAVVGAAFIVFAVWLALPSRSEDREVSQGGQADQAGCSIDSFAEELHMVPRLPSGVTMGAETSVIESDVASRYPDAKMLTSTRTVLDGNGVPEIDGKEITLVLLSGRQQPSRDGSMRVDLCTIVAYDTAGHWIFTYSEHS